MNLDKIKNEYWLKSLRINKTELYETLNKEVLEKGYILVEMRELKDDFIIISFISLEDIKEELEDFNPTFIIDKDKVIDLIFNNKGE